METRDIVLDKNGSAMSRYGWPSPRVALFTSVYNNVVDGVTRTLNRLVGHLEKAGVPVLIVAPQADADHVEPGRRIVPVPSIAFPLRNEYRLPSGLSRQARKALDEFGPTVIQVTSPDLLGIQALRYARRNNLPAVSVYHTHFASYLKYYGLGRLEPVLWQYFRWFYSQCDQVYVPTESMVEELQRHGIDEGLRLWPRGVDTERFNPSRRSMAWRRSHGIDDNDVVVTFVGRLVREKAIDVLADTFRRLSERDIPHRSVVVGDGPEHGQLKRSLPQTIFTGLLENGALSAAYASSNIFLFPSETETFGNVTLEAMASGLPAVCANANGSASLVQDGVTGFLCTPGATEEFVQSVARLIADEDLRESMGRAAYANALTYDWDSLLQTLTGFYREAESFRGVRVPLAEPVPRRRSVAVG